MDCNEALADPGANDARMQIRAYHHWLSLCGGEELPRMRGFDPADAGEFAPHGVLLRFRPRTERPVIEYLGQALLEECGLEREPRAIEQVPSRSILSRLTDHALQVVAARVPVGFEAEFDDAGGRPTAYRGILMPFSSDGAAIDYAYGVINWRKTLKKTAQVLKLFG